jgi:lipoprotein-anchoring transpeptidase ErfK/SrfK
MRVPGGKRTVVGAAVAAVAAGSAGFVTVQLASAAHLRGVSPGPNAETNRPAPEIHLLVDHPDGLRAVHVALDGVDVSGSLTRVRDGFRLPALPLADGRHSVHLAARSGGLFGGGVTRDWSFMVDTRKPRLRVETPAKRGWTRVARVSGRSEPGAIVTVAWRGGALSERVPADGRFALDPRLPDGYSTVRVVARDSAGNERRLRRAVRIDTQAPAVASPAWPAWERGTASPTLALAVTDASRLRYAVEVDGQATAATASPAGMQLPLHGLAQGLHRVSVRITDAAGNVSTVKRSLGIDTTERLTNDLTLTWGARGRDVVSLSRRLKLEGFYRGKPARRYNGRVANAVSAYEKAHAMVVDGIARPALLTATFGKIVAIQHLFRVFVYTDGVLKATFPIAVGQPAYPTPTGRYVITEKLKDPTWIPPNSPWAKGLEPIPPGGANPLGTRWMGTSATAVGFHGTPMDWSVGTAASHGCMRMHIADAERMFDLIQVGEPVEIRA